MYQEIDFFTFQQRFATDEQCRQYLFDRRWPEGFVCPKCGCKEHSYITTRALYQCCKCRYQCSVTAGTIFHRTRTPIRKLFWMVYFIAYDKNGHSALSLSRRLDVSYKVAWPMGHKIRRAMGDRDANYQLGHLLELDDAFFGGKKYPWSTGSRCKQQNQSAGGGGVEREKSSPFCDHDRGR